MKIFLIMLLLGFANLAFHETFEKLPLPSIEGQICDLFGQSLADVQVELYGRDNKLIKQIITSTNGAFDFKELESGAYKIIVKGKGFKIEEQLILLQNNEHRNLTIGLTILRVVDPLPTKIMGVVSNKKGSLLGDSRVTIQSVFNSKIQKIVFTDKNGTYQLEVADPGNYIISATCYDYSSQVHTLSISWKARGVEKQIDFKLDNEF